jgi:hypothetical protein
MHIIGFRSQALTLMEEYVRTKVKPTAHWTLREWYLEAGETAKAQDAVQRGVADGDPQSVVHVVR